MGYNLVADTDHLSTPISREKTCGHFSPEMSRIDQLSAKLEQIEISPKSDQNQWISKGIIRQNLNPKILRLWQLMFDPLSPRLLNIFSIEKNTLSLQDKLFRFFRTDFVLLHFCNLVAKRRHQRVQNSFVQTSIKSDPRSLFLAVDDDQIKAEHSQTT